MCSERRARTWEPPVQEFASDLDLDRQSPPYQIQSLGLEERDGAGGLGESCYTGYERSNHFCEDQEQLAKWGTVEARERIGVCVCSGDGDVESGIRRGGQVCLRG